MFSECSDDNVHCDVEHDYHPYDVHHNYHGSLTLKVEFQKKEKELRSKFDIELARERVKIADALIQQASDNSAKGMRRVTSCVSFV